MLVGDGSHPLDKQFRVGSPFGIPLYFHVILLIFMAFWLLSSLSNFSVARLLWPVVLIGSVYLHELGHALTSGYYGAKPRRIVLHLFGGVAYVPPGLSEKQDLWVIANGPLVSLTLAALGYGLMWVFPAGSTLYSLSFVLLYLNAILFIFNVLPIYPLDGGQFFRGWLQLRYGRTEGLRRSLPLSMATLIFMGMISIIFQWIGMFGFVIALALLFENHQEYQRNKHLFTKGFWAYIWPFGGKKTATARAKDRWPGERAEPAPTGGGLGDRLFVWWNRKKAEGLMRKADDVGILNLPPKERELLERYLDAKISIKERHHKTKKDQYLN